MLLLMVEKGIRAGISHRYPTANNKDVEYYAKNKDSLYLKFLTYITYMDGECRKSCLEMVLSGLEINLNLVKTL